MTRRSDSSVPADAGRDFVRKMGATAYTPLEAMLDAAVLPWHPAYRAEVSSISASIRPEAQRLFDADTAPRGGPGASRPHLACPLAKLAPYPGVPVSRNDACRRADRRGRWPTQSAARRRVGDRSRRRGDQHAHVPPGGRIDAVPLEDGGSEQTGVAQLNAIAALLEGEAPRFNPAWLRSAPPGTLGLPFAADKAHEHMHLGHAQLTTREAAGPFGYFVVQSRRAAEERSSPST